MTSNPYTTKETFPFQPTFHYQNDPEHDVITKENINLQTTATTSTNSIKLATAKDIDEEEEEALIEPPDEIVVHTSTLV